MQAWADENRTFNLELGCPNDFVLGLVLFVVMLDL